MTPDISSELEDVAARRFGDANRSARDAASTQPSVWDRVGSGAKCCASLAEEEGVPAEVATGAAAAAAAAAPFCEKSKRV